MSDQRPSAGLPAHLDPRGPGRSRRARGAASSVRVPSALPGAHARPRRSRARAVAVALAGLLSAAVLVSSGVGYAYFDHYTGRVDRVTVAGLSPPRGGSGVGGVDDGRPLTFLLVGSDSREGDVGERFQGEGDERVDLQRSDTMILVRLSGDGDRATAVSLPRDSWVTLPAHGSGSARVPATRDKLNEALALGGPDLLVRAVEDLSGLDVDHYVSIDFAGFLNMVDALDGVEVCLAEDVREPDSGIDLEAGRQTLTGAQALAYVRQRKELAGGDIGRIQRQQLFLSSVVREVTSTGTLTNPRRLSAFLTALTDSVSVDEGVDFRSLTRRVSGLRPADVRFETLPVADALYRPPERPSTQAIELDTPAVEELFDGIDEAPPPSEEPSPEVDPDDLPEPQDVTVEVRNGAGVEGLAGRVTDALAELGFVTLAPGNAEQLQEATVVRFAPGEEDAAQAAALALGGAEVAEDPALDADAGVVAVLGRAGPAVVAGPPGEEGAAPVGPTEAPPAPGETITASTDVCAA